MLQRAGVPLPKIFMSWEEFRQYGLDIAPKLPAGTWPYTDNGSNHTNYIVYFMRQLGRPIYHDERSSTTIADIQKWVEMWEDFRANKLVPDAETVEVFAESGVDSSSLVAGKTAVALLWTNVFLSYQNAMTDELAMITLPDAAKGANWVQTSQFMSIYKKSPNPDAAVTFIDFFVNTPDVGKILGSERGISSSKLVREAIAAQATPLDQKIYDYYAEATKYLTPQDYNLPNNEEFVNTFRLLCQQVAFKKLTVPQGSQEIYNLIQRLLVK
jgi:multiple sugar transport system substrate-binding protein